MFFFSLHHIQPIQKLSTPSFSICDGTVLSDLTESTTESFIGVEPHYSLDDARKLLNISLEAGEDRKDSLLGVLLKFRRDHKSAFSVLFL